MFDLNMTMDDARSLNIVRIYDELERRLEAVFGDIKPVLTEDGAPVLLPDGSPVVEKMVNRGYVHFYLEGRQNWPLITIEPFTDSVTYGSDSMNHEEEIRIRATIQVVKALPADPDTLMRHAVSLIRKAINQRDERGQNFLNPPGGSKLLHQPLTEKQAAQFILPEPGLPYCSVHLSYRLHHIEKT
jgi:hypothetical protein